MIVSNYAGRQHRWRTVSRLETDGDRSRDTCASLQTFLIARKAASKRIHGIYSCATRMATGLPHRGAMGRLTSATAVISSITSNPPIEAYSLDTRSRARPAGEWITTVSRRFNHPDGSFAGVVVATISASYFADYYSQFDVGQNGVLSLLSADGIMQARRPDDGTDVGRDVSGAPFFAVIRSGGPSGTFYFQSILDGRQRLGVYQRSSRYPFIVLATKAQDEVLARWRQGRDLSRAVCPESGFAHCGHGAVPRARIATGEADGGRACRQGSPFPPGGGRIERHGDPHRVG